MDKLRINSFTRASAHEAAVAQGFYAAEDLETELHLTSSSKQQMQELVDGVWQIVHTNADNVFYWGEDRGADLLIVLATPGLPNQDLVVRPEISGYPDLRGRPLAVDAAESGYATPLRVLLREHGLVQEGRDYQFVEVGATTQRIAAMETGKAFGAMVGAGDRQALTAQGYRCLDSINRLYRNHAGAVACTRAWATSNRPLVVRYLRAYLRGASWAARGGSLDPSPPPPFAWAGLQEMLELRAGLGMLRGPIDPHRFADDSFYEQALVSL